MDKPFVVRNESLYYPDGNFYIDSLRPVETCFISHAHGDHARPGHKQYYASIETAELIRTRFGQNLSLTALPYGQKIKMGNSWVSLHPAGHILGSSQIRIEKSDQVYVFSGDYKRAPDPTCAPFEVVECDLFITESTFALPIYRWDQPEEIAKQIFKWWQDNAEENHPSILFCYALGKAQRVLSLLSKYAQKPIFIHGAIYPCIKAYEKFGIEFPTYETIGDRKGNFFAKELIIAPPSAAGSPWLKRFPGFRTATASGWMQVRGTRKRKALDWGFVLSDHADWNALIQTVADCKASQVYTTHGNTHVLAQYLKEEKGIKASVLKGLEALVEEEGTA